MTDLFELKVNKSQWLPDSQSLACSMVSGNPVYLYWDHFHTKLMLQSPISLYYESLLITILGVTVQSTVPLAMN